MVGLKGVEGILVGKGYEYSFQNELKILKGCNCSLGLRGWVVAVATRKGVGCE